MPVIAALALTAVLLLASCGGEQKDERLDQAIALARQGSAAFNALDWQAYAGMVHPDDLAGLKAMLLPEIEKLTVINKSDTIQLLDQTFTIDQLRNSTPEGFFVTIIGTIFRISPELANSFQKMNNTQIGAVVQNDTLIHVVEHTTMSVGLRHVDEMNVTTVRRFGDGWRLRMSPKIQGISLMLQQSLQMQKP